VCFLTVVFCHVSRRGGCEPDAVRPGRAGESTGCEWEIRALRGMGKYSFRFYLCTTGERHGAGEEPEVEVEKMHPAAFSLSLSLSLSSQTTAVFGGGEED